MARPEPSRVVTLDHLILAVAVLPWSEHRKQDAISAIRTIARGIGKPLEKILADARTLKSEIARAIPRRANISEARWRNARSLLNAVLGATSSTFLRGRSVQKMSPAWQAIFDQIPEKKDQYRLSRYCRWATTKGIEPKDITAKHLDAFQEELLSNSLQLNTKAKRMLLVRAWNRCSRQVAGWPQSSFEVPRSAQAFTLSWDTFPPTLRTDVDAYLRHASGTDLGEDGPLRPLGAQTLRSREHLLHGHFSALVHEGVEPGRLCSIADGLSLDNYKVGLRFFDKRLGRGPTLYQRAFKLRSIARRWAKVDNTSLLAMALIVKRLAPADQGMRPKNRERLKPLRDETNLAALLNLPFEMQTELQRGRVPLYRAAVQAQIAIAIEILIFTAVRLKNLASIEVGRHLIRQADGSWSLSFDSAEVKNRRELDFVLVDDSAALIDWYVEPYLDFASNPRFLFSGRGHGRKSESCLRQQIMGAILKRTGLVIHPHLFRHIGAQIYLQENPGGHEVLRRVFGHATTKMLSKHYTGTETLSATRHFDAQIRKLRKGQDPAERGDK